LRCFNVWRQFLRCLEFGVVSALPLLEFFGVDVERTSRPRWHGDKWPARFREVPMDSSICPTCYPPGQPPALRRVLGRDGHEHLGLVRSSRDTSPNVVADAAANSSGWISTGCLSTAAWRATRTPRTRSGWPSTPRFGCWRPASVGRRASRSPPPWIGFETDVRANERNYQRGSLT
jgi:hypothetical protein